jgi:PAS domain S-box-containing protein
VPGKRKKLTRPPFFFDKVSPIGGPAISIEEVRSWQERYRVLFDRNVAGIVMTNTEGRILDCNEPCARIFGFVSRDEMLARTAWDFYFHRAERETLIDRLRTQEYCPAEEVCLRRRDGVPVWVLATRTVASFAHGLPDLLQSTFIDITAQKGAQRLRDTKALESADSMPDGTSARMADLSQRLGTLLRRVGKTLQPSNLSRIDRAEIQECSLALEHMKMLISELEIVRLLRE